MLFYHNTDPFRRGIRFCVKTEKTEINSGIRNAGYLNPIPTTAQPVTLGVPTNATEPERNSLEYDQPVYASVSGYNEPIPTLSPPQSTAESEDYLQATKTPQVGTTSGPNEGCSTSYQKLHTYIDVE